jgi:hypothetical protein
MFRRLLIRFCGLAVLAVLASGCDTQRNAYALTSTGQIIKFKTTEPTAIDNAVSVSGLASGQSLVQLALRPATGTYYGVTSDNKLATVDPESGAVSGISADAFSTDTLTNVAIAFDPVSDQLRVTASSTASTTTRENLRVDPGDGHLLNRSTDLVYDDGSGNHPQLNALAYTNSGGGGSTTLYGLDVSSQQLVRIGQSNASSVTSADEGSTALEGSLGTSFGSSIGFAIAAQDGAAYAVLGPTGSGASLYSIDLDSGAATLIGAVHDRDYTVLSLVISPVEEESDDDNPFDF